MNQQSTCCNMHAGQQSRSLARSVKLEIKYLHCEEKVVCVQGVDTARSAQAGVCRVDKIYSGALAKRGE
jgi:hypothetical protein